MPYCSRCGVEVDDGVAACPLCSAPIQNLDATIRKPEAGPYPQHIIDPEDAYRLSKAERRRIGIELLSLAVALASAALFLVDLLSDADLGWSRYAVASVVFGWIMVVAPIILYGRIKAALTIMAVAVIAFLLVLDCMDGKMDWSLTIGTPIAMTSFMIAAATAEIMVTRRVKGINLLGIGALGLAALLIALESILRIGLGTSIRPYWSIVAALALVPVAVFLFYLHGRVLRGADLRKIFRL